MTIEPNASGLNTSTRYSQAGVRILRKVRDATMRSYKRA